MPPSKKKKKKLPRAYNTRAFYAFLGLLLLTVLVYFYAAFSFSSVFAKTTVAIPGLNFPVFIGEVFLLCAGFLALACMLRRFWAPSWPLWAVFLLGAWVVWKALVGYKTAGAFAFRNAALFYYPFTAVLAYYFIYCMKEHTTSKAFINVAAPAVQWSLFWGGAALAVPAYSLQIFPFAQYVICLALPVIIYYVRSPFLKVILGIGFILALIKSGVFACTSRSHLLSIGAGVLFAAVYFSFLFGSTALRKYKWFLAVGAAGVLAGLVFFADRNVVKSLTKPQLIIEQFQYFDEEIKRRELYYEPKELPVCAYADPSNPNSGSEQRHECIGAENKEEGFFTTAVLNLGDSSFAKMEKQTTRKGQRTLGTAYVNVLFRAFIWRDMWQEYWKEKPIMGFGFEKAQRSRSLEILMWAESSWMQDGWVAPHNSFLHMFYRGGIVGVLLIVVIFWWAMHMTRIFFRHKSIAGGLMMSAVVFGLMSANFLLFFEVPYLAIPFWYVFGVTAAYAQWLAKKS